MSIFLDIFKEYFLGYFLLLFIKTHYDHYFRDSEEKHLSEIKIKDKLLFRFELTFHFILGMFCCPYHLSYYLHYESSQYCRSLNHTYISSLPYFLLVFIDSSCLNNSIFFKFDFIKLRSISHYSSFDLYFL